MDRWAGETTPKARKVQRWSNELTIGSLNIYPFRDVTVSLKERCSAVTPSLLSRCIRLSLSLPLAHALCRHQVLKIVLKNQFFPKKNSKRTSFCIDLNSFLSNSKKFVLSIAFAWQTQSSKNILFYLTVLSYILSQYHFTKKCVRVSKRKYDLPEGILCSVLCHACDTNAQKYTLFKSTKVQYFSSLTQILKLSPNPPVFQ